MCGIAGLLSARADTQAEVLERSVRAMADTLAHRGPDDAGTWVDAEAGVALGHRRLAILDLSPAGHQPMVSEDGRLVLSYNGEVYNFRELRAELEGGGHKFRGSGDTEVLLAAIGAWGLETALQRAWGMFAFALWDRARRVLWLARDRAGKKPLYYGSAGGRLLFGSELKALAAHPDFAAGIDRDALGLYLRYGWVPGPHSIYRGVRKLPAGSFVALAPGQAADAVSPRPYWSAREVAERGAREPFAGSLEEAVEALDALLGDAVGRRMISDVSLGALLSGGIDSSTVVALMQARSARPVRTFSIGFREAGFDEAGHARAVAAHLGTQHTELYLEPADALALIPKLPELYDEPFADASQIPTFAVAKLARESVTVALSGDGGDELFAGYNVYTESLRRWRELEQTPRAARRARARALRTAGRLGWRLQARSAQPRRADERRPLFARLEKRARLLDATDAVDVFARKKAQDGRGLALGARPLRSLFEARAARADLDEPVRQMLYLDFVAYLGDDILVKVDRASMGTSLEVRCPLLDHRVVELAWSLPLEMRLGDGGKRVLRRLLARYVPPTLIDRPKAGFSVPVEHWLRGPLREWGESLLDEGRLRREGFLDPAGVRRIWRQHQLGWLSRDQLLWNVLMFQAWLDAQRGPAGHRSSSQGGAWPTSPCS